MKALGFAFVCALMVACAIGVEGPQSDAGTSEPDSFVVHYFGTFSTPYVHYDDGMGWTAPPGVPMVPEGDGWFMHRDTDAPARELVLAFSDGKEAWDSNQEANYKTTLREFWIRHGQIYDQKPIATGPDVCDGVTCGEHAACDDAGRCVCDEGYALDADGACTMDPCAGSCADGELCDAERAMCVTACTPDRTVGAFAFCSEVRDATFSVVITYRGEGSIDFTASELRLNDRVLAPSDYAIEGQTLRATARDLVPSKYAFLLRAVRTDGTPVRPLYVPRWLGEGPRFADFGWRDAFMYQIMTDRFLNGDATNDLDNTAGTLAQVTDPKSQWQGGDFAGITAKIKDGYFTDMGVNALWISSPLLNSHSSQPAVDLRGERAAQRFSSYHSYHPIVTGFTHLDDLGYATPVETAFGTEAELHELVREAHLRGIRVVPDFVANHVQKEAALYTRHAGDGWFFPYNPCDGNWDAHRIDCWFTTDMPDFDFGGSAAARTRVVDHALWLIQEYNFDGFRADALKHMDDSFVRALKTAIVDEVETTVDDHTQSDEAGIFYMVGESLGGWARYHTRADMVQGQVDEVYYQRTKGALLTYQESVRSLANFAVYNDRAFLKEEDVVVWNGVQNQSVGRGGYPGAVMGNFFGNHDQVRALTEAGGRYERLELAQTFLLTSPGNIPMLYQGDDIGTLGGPDPDNRRMHRFASLSVAEQHALAHVQKLGKLREQHPALRRGVRTTRVLEDWYWVYEVTYQGDSVIVVINRDADKMYAPPAGYRDALGVCESGLVPSQTSCVFVKD